MESLLLYFQLFKEGKNEGQARKFDEKLKKSNFLQMQEIKAMSKCE